MPKPISPAAALALDTRRIQWNHRCPRSLIWCRCARQLLCRRGRLSNGFVNVVRQIRERVVAAGGSNTGSSAEQGDIRGCSFTVLENAQHTLELTFTFSGSTSRNTVVATVVGKPIPYRMNSRRGRNGEIIHTGAADGLEHDSSEHIHGWILVPRFAVARALLMSPTRSAVAVLLSVLWECRRCDSSRTAAVRSMAVGVEAIALAAVVASFIVLLSILIT